MEAGLREGTWVYYHPDGAVAARGQYVNGRLHGPWEVYWPDGRQRARGKYRLGYRDGAWKLWNADGSPDPAEAGEYDAGVHKRQDGALHIAVERRGGEPHGRAAAYLRGNQPLFEGRYRAGLREGDWQLRHADGTLDREFLSGWYEHGEWREPLRELSDAAWLPQECPDRSAGGAPRVAGLFKLGRGELSEADARALEARLLAAARADTAAWEAVRDELVARGRASAPIAWDACLELARGENTELDVQRRCLEVVARALDLGSDPLLAAVPTDEAGVVRALHRWSIVLAASERGTLLDTAADARWRADGTPQARNTRLATLVARWRGLPDGIPAPAVAASAATTARAEPDGERHRGLTDEELAERDAREAAEREAERAADAADAELRLSAAAQAAQPRLELALDWLVRHQLPSGAFPHAAEPGACGAAGATCAGVAPDELAEATCALALLALWNAPPASGPRGAPYDVARELARSRALAWLVARAQPERGTFGDPMAELFAIQQGICTLALCDALRVRASGGPRTAADPALRVLAARAVAACVEMRTPDAGWGYGGDARRASNTVCTLWMVLALDAARAAGIEVPPRAFADAGAWVRALADPISGHTGYASRGGAGYRIGAQEPSDAQLAGEAMTGAGLWIRLVCGDFDNYAADVLAPRQEYLLRMRPPRFGDERGNGDAFEWWLASRALCSAGSNHWPRYFEALADQVGRAQAAEDCARGSLPPLDAWGTLAGRAWTTAFAALALETHWSAQRLVRAPDSEPR